MFEPGIEHFLDPVQFRPPKIAHLVEPAIHAVEAALYIGETRIHVNAQLSNARVCIVES
jgi:hypothetical protein